MAWNNTWQLFISTRLPAVPNRFLCFANNNHLILQEAAVITCGTLQPMLLHHLQAHGSNAAMRGVIKALMNRNADSLKWFHLYLRHIIGQHQSSSSIFIISSANGTTGKTSQTCLFPFLKSARFLNLFKHDWKWLNLHHCVKPVTLALTWESATVMFSCFPSGQASVLLAPFVPLFIAFSQTPLMAMCLLINTLTSGKR